MDGLQVLVLEGQPGMTEHVQGVLSACSITSTAVSSWPEAKRLLNERKFSALLLDLQKTPADGARYMAVLNREVPTTPVIVVTEAGGHRNLADWAFTGAFEILNKPLDRAMLLAVLERARIRTQLVTGGALGRTAASTRVPTASFPEIIGDSEAMQKIFQWVTKVAASDANVCLYGESGTGKELIARAIHDIGRRRGRPFVVLDCAAIPEGLIESEMFGHVRGAFTSAVGDRIGVFQLADTGTLFLDEIAELPLPLQGKLLRVIQNREFRRVGSSHPIRVDARILAATNRDLAALVKAGRFREDLFYRLDVISITLPPLRQRKEDIPLLVDHFVEHFNRQSDKQIRGITARTLRLLLRYDWPGNVRELQNCIERAGVMADGDFIDISHLRQVLHPVFRTDSVGEAGPTLREREKALVMDALRQTRGNKTAAAALLGISLRGLHYKLKRLGYKGKQLGNDGMQEETA